MHLGCDRQRYTTPGMNRVRRTVTILAALPVVASPMLVCVTTCATNETFRRWVERWVS